MNIHILGIAGNMTAPLALELKRLGHHVSGSDQEKIWPPYSTILKKANIPINQTKIDKNINLLIVGSSFKNFSRTQREFAASQSLRLPYISATKYIAQNIAKKNSILIAGSHGKTTITALLVWIFKKAGLNPSYMFGGLPLNPLPSLAITDSDWSVIEADESINGLDTQAKFLYYPLKHLILTSAHWEHKDSYSSETKNLAAYQKLLRRLNTNSVLVYHPTLQSLVQNLPCRKIPYNFKLKYPNRLIGQFNQENIVAAATMSLKLGISPAIIQSAISSFRGIKQRLELVKQINHIYFYQDFAQSPPRIKQSLLAIRQAYPDCLIKVLFEPHASFLKNKNSLLGLKSAFSLSQEVVLPKLNYHSDKDLRATFSDYKNEIGDKLKYIPVTSDIIQHYFDTLTPNTALVYFSSGGPTGQKIIKKIQPKADPPLAEKILN
jgi:UDP-N-acetylmuramate: L-alanyl-gamma-D-glutamyl-meso-diaminopimelate ligase